MYTTAIIHRNSNVNYSPNFRCHIIRFLSVRLFISDNVNRLYIHGYLQFIEPMRIPLNYNKNLIQKFENVENMNTLDVIMRHGSSNNWSCKYKRNFITY